MAVTITIAIIYELYICSWMHACMHACIHQHYCTDIMESPCDGLSCLQIGLSEE